MSSYTEVDPNGDVVLVIPNTSGDGGSTKLRVSSAVLSLGSPVFRAMFGRVWQEGRDLTASSSPLEKSLPEDDPGAITAICQILHHCSDDVPNTAELGAIGILQIAQASDKYNCAAAVRATSRCWIEDALKNGDFHSKSHQMLAAAYHFDLPSTFAHIGRHLILRSDSPISTGLISTNTPLHEVYKFLESERTKAHQTILDNIDLQIASCVGLAYEERDIDCRPRCGYKDAYIRELLDRLINTKLWPRRKLASRPLDVALRDLTNMVCAPDQRCVPCKPIHHEPIGSHRGPCYYTDRPALAQKANFGDIPTVVLNQMRQLCLECSKMSGRLAEGDCTHDPTQTRKRTRGDVQDGSAEKRTRT